MSGTAQLTEVTPKWPSLRRDASAKCYHLSPPMRGFDYVIGVESGQGVVDLVGAAPNGIPQRGEANDALMLLHTYWPEAGGSTVQREFSKLGYELVR